MLAAHTYLITTLDDVAFAGQGIVGADNEWSLREALAHSAADAESGQDVIQFGALAGTLVLGSSGYFNISRNIQIVGPGSDKLTLDARDASRIFVVNGGATATISGLTLTGGNAAADHGGAVYNNGELTLQEMVLANSRAGGVGGGVFNNGGGKLTIKDSTLLKNTASTGGAVLTSSTLATTISGSAFVGNVATSGGGALALGGATGGVVSILNSTFSDNRAQTNAGAIQVAAPSAALTVVNSTITDNKLVSASGDGGGLRIYSGSAALHNSIVAGNVAATSTVDVGGAILPASANNLFSQATVNGLVGGLPTAVASTIFVDDPAQAGYQPLLADNGGPTKTHALRIDSPAIDQGSNAAAIAAAINFDQRGYNRFVDNAAHIVVERGAVDVGAYEYGLVVTAQADGAVGASPRNDLSLREALALAAKLTGPNQIEFASGVEGDVSLSVASHFVIDSDVSIVGPGADKLTLDAHLASRVFVVNAGATATISGLTLARGKAVADHGGAIYNNGDLTLQETIVANSRADGIGVGGGVFNNASGKLTIKNSTFLNNTASTGGGVLTSSTLATTISGSAFIGNVATSGGGALALGGAAGGAVSILNSTFSGNQAAIDSGAIQVAAPSAALTVVNSTITNNKVESSSGLGGGLRTYTGSATLHNTIVAGNFAGAAATVDVGGAILLASANNLFSQATVTGPPSGQGNQFGASPVATFVDDPALPGYQPLLADNGGPTKSHALRIGSPAIDQGSNAKSNEAQLKTDQRGFNRFANGNGLPSVAVDIGAFELVASQVTASQETIGDFNGDGRDDRLRFDPTTRSLQVVAAAATAAQYELQSWGILPVDVTSASTFIVGEFNGDGRDDLLIRAFSTSSAYYLAISDGASFILHAATLPGNWGPIYVGDFDADGSDEILGGTGSGSSYSWSVAHYQDASGLGAIVPVTITGFSPGGELFIQDANRDGREDIITRAGPSSPWMVRLAGAAGTVTFQTAADWTSWIAYGYHQATAKLDADKAMAKVIKEFAWVYNNVELELYAGLMKGPEATEQTKTGNDWDQAALLERQLQAIAAFGTNHVKIASGRVRVSIDQLREWLGLKPSVTVSSVQTIVYNLLDKSVALTNPSTIEFTHTWVQAYVPTETGLAWVNLDPSWKFKDRQEGIPLSPELDGIHTDLSTGVFDEFSYLALNPATDRSLPVEFFADQAMNWLVANHPGASLADLAYDGPIITKSFERLPTGLDANLTLPSPASVATYESFDAIASDPVMAAELTHRVLVGLERESSPNVWVNEWATTADPLLKYQIIVPRDGQKTFQITFSPTANGRTNPNDIAPLGPSQTFWSRLVVNGVQPDVPGGPVDYASQSVLSSSNKIRVTVEHRAPNFLSLAVWNNSNKYPRAPGQVLAISLDANQHSSESLAALQAQVLAATTGGTTEIALRPAIDDLVAYAGAKYWHDFNRDNRAIERLTQTIGGQARVGSGLITADPELLTVNGSYLIDYLPYGIAPENFGVDLPNAVLQVFKADAGTVDNEVLQLAIFNGSALEHTIVEETIAAESISTAKGLQRAYQRNLGLGANGLPSVTSGSQSNGWDQVRVFVSYMQAGVRKVDHRYDVRKVASGSDVNSVGVNGVDLSDTEFKDLLEPHDGHSGLDDQLWKYFDETLTDNDGTVTVYVPQARTSLGAWQNGAYVPNSNWEGGVYFAEIEGKSLQFAIVQDGGGVTNGGYSGGVTTPPPPELPLGSFANATWAGDPVHVANGNMFRDETDIFFPNIGVPLTFSRHYDSQSKDDVGMGVGWTYSFSDMLYLDEVGTPSTSDDEVVWIAASGARHRFKKLTENTFATPAELKGTLTRQTTSEFPNGFKYVYLDPSGIEYHFQEINDVHPWNGFDGPHTSIGRLRIQKDHQGNGVRINYINPTQFHGFTEVHDLHDPTRRLVFSYQNGQVNVGRIVSIKKYDGGANPVAEWTYGYLDIANGEESEKRLHTASSPAVPIANASYLESTLPTTVTYDYYNAAVGDPAYAKGLIKKITERDGSWHTYEYYRNGRAFRVKQGEFGVAENSANADVQTFNYNLLRNLTEFVDERGNVETYIHQSNGLLEKQIHDDRSQTKSTWGAAGTSEEFLMKSTTDERGAKETFTYYASSDFKKGQLQTSTEKAYPNSTGQVPNALVTNYDYAQPDSSKPHLIALWTTVVDPDASPYIGKKITTKRDYYDSGDAKGKLKKTTDAENNVVEYSYYVSADDGPAYRLGLLKSITQPSIVDSAGAPVQYETIFNYDAAGNVTKSTTQTVVTAPAVPVVIAESIFAYDSWGNVKRSVDPSGVVRETVFDVLGRTLETGFGDSTDIADPIDAFTSRFKYDKSGRVRETTDPLGRVTRFEYDRQGNVVKQINPDGTELLHEYDSFGNRIATTDALQRTTRFVYDSHNRLIQTIRPDGATERLRYDGVGNVVASIDALGNVTTFRYDAAGLLLETKLPDPDGPNDEDGDGDNLTSPTTTNKYDKLGNLTATIDPELNVTQYKHDKLGRVVETRVLQTVDVPSTIRNVTTGVPETTRAAALTTIDYDAVGYVKQTTAYDTSIITTIPTDPRSLIASDPAKVHVVSMRYDALGRLAKTVNADNTKTSATYDAAGRIRYQYDELNRVTEFRYDAFGRLEKILLPDPTTGAISETASPTTVYQYDAVGNRIATTDPRGSVTRFEYDVFNRLIAATDPMGGRTRSIYDVAGQMVAAVDALGRVAYTLYDERGRAIQQRAADPDGDASGAPPVTRFVYDAAGRLLKQTDPLGYDTTYLYDRLGRLKTETHVAAAFPSYALASRSFAYDANGNVVNSIDELNRATDYQFDELDRTTIVQLPAPGPYGVNDTSLPRPQTTTAYDGYGNVKSVDELRGGGTNQRKTAYAYDVRNRRIEEILDDGTDVTNGVNYVNQKTVFAYDFVGNLTYVFELAENAVTSGNFDLLRTTAYKYDKLNRLIRETQNTDGNDALTTPVERVTTTTYDANGNVLAITENAETSAYLLTLYEYDKLNRVVSEIAVDWPTWRATRFQYDAVGNQTAVIDAINPIDPIGRTTRNEYDRLNSLVESTAPDPDGPGGPLAPEATRFAYYATGLLLSETNGAFETKAFAYDPQGRLTHSTEGGETTIRRYDLAGNLIRLIDPAGNDTIYAYDGLDRLTLETNESGDSRKWIYHANGTPFVTVDRNGKAVRRMYDRLDRVRLERWYNTESEAEAGSSTGDGTFNRTDEFAFHYDALGRLDQQSHFHRDSQRWIVDSYLYDGLDRVIEHSNQSLYSANHSTGVPALTQTYAYGYDSVGRTVTREQFVAGQFAASTKSTYNAFGELVKLTDSNIGAGGASTILDFESTDAAFAYYEDGALASTTRYTDWDAAISGHRNRVQTNYAYDDAGRLKQIAHAQNRRSTATWPVADTAIVSFAYDYDAASRIGSITTDWNVAGQAAFATRADETQSFAYDALGQLKWVVSTLSGSNALYSYGANGNRANASEPGGGNDFYTPGLNNRVSEDSTYSYQYDQEGNLTRRESKSDATDYETYGWDQRHRLTQVNRYVDAALAESVAYRYNAADEPVYRSVTPAGQTAQVEHYVVEAGQRTMTVEGDGDVLHRYQFGPTGEALFDQSFDGYGAPASQSEVDLRLPLGDHQNSTRVVMGHYFLADHILYVRQSIDYDPFGRVREVVKEYAPSPAPLPIDDLDTIFAHHGSIIDPAAELYLKGQRWYSPDLGRFVSEDPIQDGANWYMFAGNDPVNYADPSGLSMQGYPLAGGYSGNATMAPTINSGSIPANNLGLGPSLSPSTNNFLRGAVNQAINPGVPSGAPTPRTSAFDEFNRGLTNSSTFSALTRQEGLVAAIVRESRESRAHWQEVERLRNTVIRSEEFGGGWAGADALALGEQYELDALRSPTLAGYFGNKAASLGLNAAGFITNAVLGYTTPGRHVTYGDGRTVMQLGGPSTGALASQAAVFAPVILSGASRGTAAGRGFVLGETSELSYPLGTADEQIAAFRAQQTINRGHLLEAPSNRGIWDLTPEARWTAVEQNLGKNLPGNFKTIDRFDQGVATSIKSLDLGAKTYANSTAITRVGQGYVDTVASYKGGTWNKITIDPKTISGRAVDLAVPPNATAAQRAALKGVVDYGKQKGVVVNIVEIR